VYAGCARNDIEEFCTRLQLLHVYAGCARNDTEKFFTRFSAGGAPLAASGGGLLCAGGALEKGGILEKVVKGVLRVVRWCFVLL
jgi:hypothetical protein